MTLPQLAPRTQVSFAPAARGALARLVLRPGVAFFHGHEQSSRLAHYFLAAPLARGETVLFLDAANCFDPFKVAKFARRCGREPREFLQRVRVSRAFTCFQMAELVERTARAAQRFGARCVVLTGFPDIFDDEEIPAAQAKAAFARTRPHFHRWAALRLRALAFSDRAAHASPLRKWLMRELGRWAAAVYRLEEGPAGLALREEKQTFKPAPKPVGQTFLRALSGAEGSASRARPEARPLLPVAAGSTREEI